MIGSWAGAMGHTQWMPEVWLHMGVDYDRDGRVSPFGKPDDSLAGTARYLLERGKYRRGEAWGCEVKLPAGHARLADNRTLRPYAKWHELGVKRADGAAFARPNDQVKLWLPVAGGPAFLVGQNFRAVYSYNPSTNYSLALVHLGDLIRGDPPFHQQFPGGERVPTLDEVKEIQRRLNEHGFKTDGIDGRTGSDTVQGDPRVPEEGRHGAGRRLCRAEGAGAVTTGRLMSLERQSNLRSFPRSGNPASKRISTGPRFAATSGGAALLRRHARLRRLISCSAIQTFRKFDEGLHLARDHRRLRIDRQQRARGHAIARQHVNQTAGGEIVGHRIARHQRDAEAGDRRLAQRQRGIGEERAAHLHRDRPLRPLEAPDAVIGHDIDMHQTGMLAEIGRASAACRRAPDNRATRTRPIRAMAISCSTTDALRMVEKHSTRSRPRSAKS